MHTNLFYCELSVGSKSLEANVETSDVKRNWLSGIRPSVCLSPCLWLCLSVYLSGYRSCVYVSVDEVMCLCVCCWGHVSMCLCVCWCVNVSVDEVMCQCVCWWGHVSMCLLIRSCVYVSVDEVMCLCICQSLCLFHSLCDICLTTTFPLQRMFI